MSYNKNVLTDVERPTPANAASPVDEDLYDPDFDVPDDVIPPDDERDGRYDDEPWLTIATYWQQTEAHIARLKLESEEIDCFLLDENLVATDWLMANAVGGIKLQVRQSSVERATSLLKMLEKRADKSEVFEPTIDRLRETIAGWIRRWTNL